MPVIASRGTRGYRVRIPGMQWQSVSEREFERYTTREARRAMAAVDAAVRTGRVRRLPELRRRRPYLAQTSVLMSRHDIIRVWSDVYYRIPEDMVHGFVRIAAYMDSETSVAVTFWCRPRGHGWRPMYGRVMDGEQERVPNEVGWICDIEDTNDVLNIS